MQTFGEVIQEVLRFGFEDGPQVNRKRIENWVNEAQFQIAREVEAPEFQKTKALVLVPGTYKYALPTNFLRMQDVYYPEMVMRLKAVDIQDFDQLGQGKFTSRPEVYTLYGNEIWLFPSPNNADELELRYIEDPPAMTEESAVPVLNQNYLHLLVQYAVARAFEAEDDPEQAQAHIQRYTKDLAAYATDVQWRLVDRPRIQDGTWGGSSPYGGYT